jgi:exosortase
MPRRPPFLSAAICGLAVALTYAHVATRLAHDWWTDDNYSHGFFIIPLSVYFAWLRRDALLRAPQRPSVAGLLVIAGSLALLVAGTLGAELFLARVSMVGVVAGLVLFVLGRNHLRLLAFPIAFLLLMVPLPAVLFNQIAFPLQLIASQFGEAALRLLHIPVLREGNLIVLANTTLEVAEACSGIRSLVTMLTLGIVVGYVSDARTWVRTVLALSTIPIAIVTNGLRVAGTGVAAHYAGPEAATGFLHTFSGWLMFVVAFGLLMLVRGTLASVAPPREAIG